MSKAVLNDGVIYLGGFQVVGKYDWRDGEIYTEMVKGFRADADFFHSLWLELENKDQARLLKDKIWK